MNELEAKEKGSELKKKLDELNEKIKVIEKNLNPILEEKEKLMKSCKHFVVCDDCKKAQCQCDQNEWHCGSARCLICDKYIGSWYCPDSPDHQCYYFTKEDSSGNAYIELRDKSRVYMPKDYDNREYETDDSCLFCGQPEERK